jgi:hypothetical protein
VVNSSDALVLWGRVEARVEVGRYGLALAKVLFHNARYILRA